MIEDGESCSWAETCQQALVLKDGYIMRLYGGIHGYCTEALEVVLMWFGFFMSLEVMIFGCSAKGQIDWPGSCYFLG